jgi:single-stranded-DNA-specific exonuclease
VGDCTAAPDLADLAGVGVAFFLAAAAAAKLAEAGRPRVDVRPLLDMVALGTLADVVALRGQNRILAKNGLLLVAEAARPGIAALKEASGFAVGAALGAGQVTFGLAPRINAAGRMGEAETALQMLLAPDLDTARPLAARLDAMNRDRRREEERILEQALEQAAEQVAAGRLGLVLHQDDWHPGVIGIVASRVVEETYRPCLILCREGEDRLKGSGRSVREFDLHAGLTCCSDVLLGFGGHRQAAGLSLAPENLEALRERFHRTVEEALGPEPLTAGLRLDGDLPFTDIDFTLLKELELLQPFGPGNPEPVFASPPVRVGNRRVFGKNHVALELRDPDAGVTLKGKAWRQAEALGPEVVGRTMRLAFTPKIDRYNGVASIDLRIKDWNEPSH